MLPPEEQRDALEDALDDMYDEGQLFLGKYEVRSSMHVPRPGGGQGLVQFARDPGQNADVAIKVSSNSQHHKLGLHL